MLCGNLPQCKFIFNILMNNCLAVRYITINELSATICTLEQLLPSLMAVLFYSWRSTPLTLFLFILWCISSMQIYWILEHWNGSEPTFLQLEKFYPLFYPSNIFIRLKPLCICELHPFSAYLFTIKPLRGGVNSWFSTCYRFCSKTIGV